MPEFRVSEISGTQRWIRLWVPAWQCGDGL